jgi:hypothetical protein
MKDNMKKYLIALVGLAMAACHNGPLTHPNFDRTAVYFSYQTPIRTIVLGEDGTVDTSLDNEYRCQIISTIGGFYVQNNNVEIDFKVDNSLCDNIAFAIEGGIGADVRPMPSTYYTLGSPNKITIPKGEILGRLDVQLTEEFFADPLATENNYVIPIVMTGVRNADSILMGLPLFPNPRRVIDNDWDILPKDYVLYAVKYINRYTGNWLRGGKDVFSGSKTGTEDRSKKVVNEKVTDKYVEEYDPIATKTRGLNVTEYPVRVLDADNNGRECTLLLTFDASGACTITTETAGVTVSGNGRYEARGAKLAWGDKDRDLITLNYTLDFGDMQVATEDVLVMRDRGVRAQEFTPALKELTN